MLIDTYLYAVVIYNVWNNIKLTIILLWKLCIKIRGPSTGTGTSNMRPVAISYNIYSGIPTKSWMFPVHLELHPAKSNLNYLPFESLLHEPHQEPHVLHIQPLANYHQSCMWRQSIALKGLDGSGESLTSTSKAFLCSWATCASVSWYNCSFGHSDALKSHSMLNDLGRISCSTINLLIIHYMLWLIWWCCGM